MEVGAQGENLGRAARVVFLICVNGAGQARSNLDLDPAKILKYVIHLHDGRSPHACICKHAEPHAKPWFILDTNQIIAAVDLVTLLIYV